MKGGVTMAVTMKQIASMAGVSTGTVNRALNNKGRINPEVADRIRAIAAELNYQPNSLAKSLSIKRFNLKIAVILHVTHNQFVDSVLSGIRSAADELVSAGIAVDVMPCSDFDAECQLSLIDQAVENSYNGIVIFPIDSPIIKARIDRLYDEDFPVIFLTTIIEGAKFWAYVGCDYGSTGPLSLGLIKHLSGGEGRLAVMLPSLQMWSNSRRLSSIKSYLAEDCPGIELMEVLELSNDNIESYLQSRALLENRKDIDCVLYCSGAVDGGLKAVIGAARTRRMSIVSFDLSDTIRSALTEGDITFTIFQNPPEQGYRAIMLMSRFLVNHPKVCNENCYIEAEILIKESLMVSGKYGGSLPGADRGIYEPPV